MVSLDNNKAERQIRGPVVTRKNAGGSRNDDSARNAAVIWTVTATAQMAGLNILTYLAAYLDECGRNSGEPLTGPALERFLPWSASPEDLRTWAQPPPARVKPCTNKHRHRSGHREPPHRPSACPSQDFRILTLDLHLPYREVSRVCTRPRHDTGIHRRIFGHYILSLTDTLPPSPRCTGFPRLGYYGGSAPPAPSAGVAPIPASQLGDGRREERTRVVPAFTAVRSTG